MLASWNFDKASNKARSFIAKNLGSVDQRAAKLLAHTVWFEQLSRHPAHSGWAQNIYRGALSKWDT